MENKTNTLKAVDFFCGGGGMSYGMLEAGINVLAGIDFEPNCKKTYEDNITGAQFIQADVFDLKEEELEIKLNLNKNDDDLILIGCSPCQFWSIINTNRDKSTKSANLLIEFARFVKHLNPGYVVVENVPGVLRKKKESGLEDFIVWLEENHYKVHFEVHNVADYGVPQSRKRFTLIANRVTSEKLNPIKKEGKKVTVRDVIGEPNGFPKINDGNKDNTEFIHTVPAISEINKRRLKKIQKDGGNRLGFANDSELQLPCFVGKDNWFKDTFGRLWWDRPSPTITTKFLSISNGRFAHPEEDRALSLREGATLQSFPKDYKFHGTSTSSIARLIGNAVPPEYAKCIGEAIIKNHING
ncbi:DNA cytosine methyltransferase [Flavobacterium salmonis]|uniref:DNA (cytosine-5-)-methyltransferase n=1 Tax=Flavobacterium salmonis TaxID=2654844 RepID=A0A6V6YQG5_9FLAO|nr:DNA cytosine methyltransferase [Flavobacterium salmonis]CAD0001626.1 putative BsuMI modification methylase subunit YdiO [Flavobacterium salmonis]